MTKTQNRQTFEKTLLSNNKPYYVYVLRSILPIKGKYTVKIGKTERKADLRKKEIESNNPFPMKVVAEYHRMSDSEDLYAAC